MSPGFEVARAIGNNTSKSFKRVDDTNAIESILSQAVESEDPKVLQDSIGKILSQVSPERQGVAIKYLESVYENVKEKQALAKKEAAEKKVGVTSGLHPSLQAQELKDKNKEKRLSQYGFATNSEIPQVQNQSGIEPIENQNQKIPQNRKSLKDFSVDELKVFTGHPDKEISEPAKAELKSRQKSEEESGKKFERDRAFHSKTSEPIVADANKILKSAPIKKGLINQHRRDIESGNVSGFGQFVADKTGWEIFRNPEAARARSAAKQYFIQSLNSLASGARPNMFIEQQLSAGQTQIGREEESNQTVLDLMEFTDDLEAQRAKYVVQEAEKDRKEHGYVLNDVDARADKKMIKYAEQREDEMAYTIRKRHEDELDDEKLTREVITGNIPSNTPLTLRMARILMIKNNDDEKKAQAEAKKLGFKIPSEETYRKG